MARIHMFPYSLVEKDSRVILAGAGEVGRSFAEQIQQRKYCEIAAVTDRNYAACEPVCGIKVVPHQDILTMNYDKVVVAVDGKLKASVLADLNDIGVKAERIVSSYYPYMNLQAVETVEAIIVKYILNSIGIPRPTYMDVGACHPVNSSNTMFFYANGSRGINIEPDKSHENEFLYFRPEDINLFIGVAAHGGSGKFYRADDEYLSTFSLNSVRYAEEHKGIRYSDFEMVPLMTLNEVVNQYCGGIFPDFLDIDIEGLDAEVLESMDVSVSSPKIICAEGDPAILDRILTRKSCGEYGSYMRYCCIPANAIYLREDVYENFAKSSISSCFPNL